MRLMAIRDRIGRYVDEFTEHWIGWTLPPVPRVIEDGGWAPDTRQAYCGRCGDSVGIGEASDLGCATCREGGELEGGVGDGIVRLGAHVDHLRDWILKIKYQRWSEMGQWLGKELAKQIRAASVVDPDQTLVVPIPMPWQRRLTRGIDHAHLIAAAVARELRVPLANMLTKANHPPQVTLSVTERRRTGGRGLGIRRRWGGWPVQGLHLLLIDDVRTTGTTLRAAVRLLRSLKPGRTVCGVLAVSDSKARRDRANQPTRPVGGAVPQRLPDESSVAQTESGNRALPQKVQEVLYHHGASIPDGHAKTSPT
jgi:ComF family protein